MLGQIRQVLANLVSNAIDAAPLDGKLAIRSLQRDGGTGFVVQDNGGGMSEWMRPRLFEPFLSTKGDLGNELGLYISPEVLERHHGHIEVASSKAGGTTMTVWLPAKESRLGDESDRTSPR